VRHPFLRTLAATPTDPNFENVTLLLHGDGTNGGQNNTFVDGSTNNFAITRNGNTTQGTFSPYGDNWSNYFDGTGDYLTRAFTSTTDGMYLQGTTYTVEAWVFPLTSTGTRVVYDCSATSTTNFGQTTLYLDGTAVGYSFRPTTGGASTLISGGTLLINNWNHVAVSVNAGSARVFLNGTQVGSTTTISAASFTPVGAGIGRFGNNFTTGVADYTGYISNVRVVQSTALYTANFTPSTTPLTAITNTSLLTCQSNRFRDASTNNFTITRNGDVSVQRFSPFSPTAAYAAGTIGGSGYFDGSGDYLVVPSGAFSYTSGTAYTFECWIYPTSYPVQYPNIFTANVSSGSNTASMYIENNGSCGFGQANVGTVVVAPAGSIRLGCWNHIAVGKNSSNSVRMWVNGVSVATGTDTTNYAVGATRIGLNALNANPFAGYIGDFRSVAGSDVYGYSNTTITVPTAPLSSVANTQLLLLFQNAAIIDNAMMAVPETVGNAQIDTTIKQYGTGSMKFDGTGDYLTIRNNPAFNFGDGDFTIECWVYIAGNSAPDGGGNRTAGLFSAYAPSGVVSRGYTFEVEGNASTTGTGLSFYNNVSGSQTSVIATTTISQTTWHHVAVTRSGTTTRLFLNGTLIGSGTLGNQNVNSDYPAVVGRLGYASYLQELNGYIDDLCVTKGVARYTATFTRPTAAFPDL